MDNLKYTKQKSKLLSSKSKTRSIGVNTEDFTCQIEDTCPKILLVPYLPYYYPMCAKNVNNNCGSSNLNINPNILNQYQFVNNANNCMENVSQCSKHSNINLLHCCSSNSTTCTNCSPVRVNNNKMNTFETNTNVDNKITSGIPIKKNSQDSYLKKNSQVNLNLSEKHSSCTFPATSCNNTSNSFYEPINENIKQYCDTEMNGYGTDLLDNQNYRTQQDYNHVHKVNDERNTKDEKKILNHLLTPTRRNFSNKMNAGDDSDDCVESENDEVSSIEEEVHSLVPVTIKATNQDEEDIVRPNTADSRVKNNLNLLKNFSKPNNSKSSDFEMLMMLKAFVNQSGDKDVNPKLNQLINHLSSPESSLRLDGQIDSKKSALSRK